MPQIFQEETLSMVWDMITVENMKMREVANILCCTYDRVNQMYQAAYRRWGNNQHTNRKRTISVRKIGNPKESERERPPAVYSNKSYINQNI